MVQDTNTTVATGKQPISMVLIQNYSYWDILTEHDKERIYQNFRKRSAVKSEHRYRDEGDRPRLLRLQFIGTSFDSTQEMLVEVGSFQPTMRLLDQGAEKEIGFEVWLKSPMTPGKTHRLEVLRKQHKATLYITL